MDKILHMPKSLESAEALEEILCLSALIACGILPENATLADALSYYTNKVQADCGSCPLHSKCLACIINI